MLRADLHMHTTFSDGTYTPEELMDHAVEKKLDIIAITDHDTLTSTPDIYNLAKERSLTFIPGIEFSTIFEGIPIHILGYFVDRASEPVVNLLKRAKGSRQERNRKMIELFKEHGIEITWDELKEISGSEIISRPHFAQLLIQKGVVKDIRQAFAQYLADDAKCCPKREELPAEEVIEAIRESNGLSSLAHPNVYDLHTEEEYSDFIGKLKEKGLQAIEVYYSKHSAERREFFLKLAEKFDLIASGGSDFHGENKKNAFLGEFYGVEKVYENIEHELKQRGITA